LAGIGIKEFMDLKKVKIPIYVQKLFNDLDLCIMVREGEEEVIYQSASYASFMTPRKCNVDLEANSNVAIELNDISTTQNRVSELKLITKDTAIV